MNIWKKIHIIALCVLAVAAVVVALSMMLICYRCGKNSGETLTDDSMAEGSAKLIGCVAADEFTMSRGINASREVPCPEFGSIEEAEAVFVQSGINYCFVDYIARHPATMRYPFDRLQHPDAAMPVRVVDSPDDEIRFYGWDNHLGGICTCWDAIYQIADKGKVYTYHGLPDWGEELFLVTDVYALPHPKRQLYILSAYYQQMGILLWQTFYTYERSGTTLKRVPLFCTNDGEVVDHVDVEYDPSDYYYRYAMALDFDALYCWNETRQNLYVPNTRQSNSRLISDRYTSYHWDGRMLQPADDVPNPNIHPSLADYVQVEQVFETKHHLMRIDSVSGGRFRYAAWSGTKDMGTEPDIILLGERVDEEVYRFRNKTYTYMVHLEWENPRVDVYYSRLPGELGDRSDRHHILR